jgi:soluble lytic murein transglycosylase-like protein
VTAAADWHRRLLAGRPAPSRLAVRLLIRSTARAVGVDPALALAVAQQESGFQQRVVSPADAIGVMQVLPSTGRWVGNAVVGRPLDLLDVEDNVLAGVTLLRVLGRAAPTPQAVAGYYQGLASVRRNGMLPDTRRYVANVLRLRARWR